MLSFYQKRKLRGWLTSPYVAIIIGCLSVVVLWEAGERYIVARDAIERSEQAERIATELVARQAELQAEVAYLQNERGIEAAMRRQFNVALPGEEIIVIIEPEEPDVVVEPLKTTASTTTSPWWWPF